MINHSTQNPQPIPPLTKGVLPQIPWLLNLSGWLSNRWNESVVEAILSLRDPAAVRGSWQILIPDSATIDGTLSAFGHEMGWLQPRFIPMDACSVVMKLWWHGVADCMERERTIISLEKVWAKKISPATLKHLEDLTLEQLFKGCLK